MPATGRLRNGRLPELLRDPQRGDKMVAALAVHVLNVETLPQFRSEEFSFQVKYGDRNSCLRCQTSRFSPQTTDKPVVSRLCKQKPASLPAAEVESLCLFRLYDPVLPVVRLSLQRASRSGIGTCTVGKVSTSIKHLKGRQVAELSLRGRDSKDEIGRVSVALEILWVKQQDLARSLMLAAAEEQKDAYMIPAATPTIAGSLVDDYAKCSIASDVSVQAPVLTGIACGV
mmetsp:Transcript_68524/g.172670  ORF Transcript_68524/g.172670 Transcript_68524/m.172670 type:complete len:229 (-) Transcript_68524:272-958(-)